MAAPNDKEFSNVSDTLFDFLSSTVDALTKSLRTVREGRGANATGALSESIAENIQNGVQQTRGGFTMEIELNDYYIDVDEGQPVGTRVPQASILHWVKNKPNLVPRQPILPDEQIAYLITRKILEKGTEATHFYSDVMTDKRIKQLFSDLEDAGAEDITTSLDNTFE